MQRKDFLLTALAATPLLVFPQTKNKNYSTKTPFLVKAGKSRFNDLIKLGPNTNDVKISKSDTNNQLSVFEYAGFEKSGPPCMFISHKTKFFR